MHSSGKNESCHSTGGCWWLLPRGSFLTGIACSSDIRAWFDTLLQTSRSEVCSWGIWISDLLFWGSTASISLASHWRYCHWKILGLIIQKNESMTNKLYCIDRTLQVDSLLKDRVCPIWKGANTTIIDIALVISNQFQCSRSGYLDFLLSPNGGGILVTERRLH